ncbi:MAG: hypothetical protein ACE5MK_00095 [Acidobacteriota bacterium]
MDTFSHAAWGYAALRWRGPQAARLGALAGAGPDLLYLIPSKIEQVFDKGWTALFVSRTPGIWRAHGPPLPPDLVEAYRSYYVYTHSLVIVTLVLGILLLLGKRRWLWFALPYTLHIVMDVPTHERYLTPIFYPLSDWTFLGLSWADPRIFWPNVIALLTVFTWIWWKYHGQLTADN